MEYVKYAIVLFFILTQAYIAYKKYKQEKLNTFLKLANQAYHFIRKENLLGKIVDDERLVKALEMLEKLLYGKGIMLTPDMRAEAENAFQSWHAEDKAKALTMNSVAAESGKKPEGD